MSWDEKAKDEARETYFSATPTAIQTRMVSPFVEGARWQRDQLRTDEAVERMANFLHNDDYGETIPEHEATCELGGCDTREAYMYYASAAITALIGDET